MEENINIQRGATPVQTQPQQTTSTFNFPTQVISLPSEGKVYVESNPLSKGTLEIKYLTAREEDILADSNLINKGVVLDKLLESVVVQVGVNADDLVTGDKKEIYKLARKSYFAVLDEGDGGAQDFIHTEQFILVDKKKRIRGYYDGTDSKEIKRIIDDIYLLKKEK